jgi:hypothetical protein
MGKWLIILLSAAISLLAVLAVREITIYFGVIAGLASCVVMLAGAIVVRLKA